MKPSFLQQGIASKPVLRMYRQENTVFVTPVKYHVARRVKQAFQPANVIYSRCARDQAIILHKQTRLDTAINGTYDARFTAHTFHQ